MPIRTTAEQLERDLAASARSDRVIITGGRNVGKTSAMGRIMRELEERKELPYRCLMPDGSEWLFYPNGDVGWVSAGARRRLHARV